MRVSPSRSGAYCADNPPKSLTVVSDQQNALCNKPMRPLVVVLDDEEVFRSMVCEHLNAAGYETFGAASANKAWTFLVENKRRTMILITDMVLRGEGGWSLAQQVRSGFPSVAIVFMSGLIGESAIPEAVLHRNAAFLRKPFSLDALIDTLQSLKVE